MNRGVLAGGLLLVLPLLGILYVNLGRDPHVVESPLVGKPAPPFALKPVGGGEVVTLASLRGRPVVLNFWATWCAPCFEEHPALTKLGRQMGKEVAFLGVVYQDEEANVQGFQKRYGGAYASLLDPESKTAIAYGVAGVPETFFIDPSGRIVSKYVGALDERTINERIALAAKGSR